MSVQVRDAVLSIKGYQQLTSLSAASTLTVPDGARYAMIQAETQNVRYRDDGVDPTASVGMVITAGQQVWYTGALQQVRLIEVTPSAKVNVLFYG